MINDIKQLAEKLIKNKNKIDMKRKTQEWKIGDIFIIELENNNFSIGQILDHPLPNFINVGIFYNNITKDKVESLSTSNLENTSEYLISTVWVHKNLISNGNWKTMFNSPIFIDQSNFANERFRNKKWIGAKMYDAELLEDFLNAHAGLKPWDDWFDPHYLDGFLYDKTKKPANLIYKNK